MWPLSNTSMGTMGGVELRNLFQPPLIGFLLRDDQVPKSSLLNRFASG
jgi:hypothetical protein